MEPRSRTALLVALFLPGLLLAGGAAAQEADTTPPELIEVEAIGTTNDSFPDYTFSSSEAGTVTYGGACSGTLTTAVAGTNTTYFSLSHGEYDDCTIIVTDAAGNAATLGLTPFEIDQEAPSIDFDQLQFREGAPVLSGSVDDPSAAITVSLEGEDFDGENLGDGTWRLDVSTVIEEPLDNDIYEIYLSAMDELGNTRQVNGMLVIDGENPRVTGLENDTTPRRMKVWVWEGDDITATEFRFIVTQLATTTLEGTYGTTTTALQSGGDGLYYLHIQAKDELLNESGVVTVSAILDNTAPVVTLRGSSPFIIFAGSSFIDPGATALDALDGDVSGSVVVTGTPDTATPGNYSVTYSATDIAGNVGAAVRTVTVLPLAANQIVLATTTVLDPLRTVVAIGNGAASAFVAVPDGVADPELDLSSLLTGTDTRLATLPASLIAGVSSTIGEIRVEMPQDLQISGPAGWSGALNLPRIFTPPGLSGLQVNGSLRTFGASVEFGGGDLPLTLSRAVRILLPGQAGKKIGVVRNNWVYEILRECTNDAQASADSQLGANEDCKMAVGADAVVWTKHLSVFAAYSEEVIRTGGGGGSGGGGGGGGGGFSVPAPPVPVPLPAQSLIAGTSSASSSAPGQITSPARPRVLGVTSYLFTSTLRRGMQGAAVRELQDRLRAEGFFDMESTGYFGAVTERSVKAYQKSKNLPQVGQVGPLTRSHLNKDR